MFKLIKADSCGRAILYIRSRYRQAYVHQRVSTARRRAEGDRFVPEGCGFWMTDHHWFQQREGSPAGCMCFRNSERHKYRRSNVCGALERVRACVRTPVDRITRRSMVSVTSHHVEQMFWPCPADIESTNHRENALRHWYTCTGQCSS